MSLETVREFLGWCTVINFGMMIVSFLLLQSVRDKVSRLHAKLTGLDQTSLQQAYFQFFANYKIAIIVFNLVPYLALRLIG